MQPFFQTIGEYWQALGAFFAFDAALLAEPSMVLRLVLLAVLLFSAAFFFELRDCVIFIVAPRSAATAS